MKVLPTTIFAIFLCAFSTTSLFGQSPEGPKPPEKEAAAKIDAGLIRALKMRSIGPALMSGRIGDVAIDRRRPNTWYVAAGSGNLWKTTNAGTTWQPIFENYGSYSIGCVTIDPDNSSTIWVGTGENVGGRHVGFGDGVYRSDDGGRSFRNVGLKTSEHISRIVVTPGKSDIVYAASQGPLWSAGGERGLFKTTDGGKTWKNILSRGKYTGVTDVVMDPRDSRVLYAATHQRHRTVWALLNGGPESGIHKSTDGGKTWRELQSGLPAGDKGKIALGISPMKPDVVYASIELAGRKGGFYKSTDAGATWSKQSDYLSGGTGPHYYQEIYVDPHRFDVIYHANVQLGRTEDGGKTFQSVARPSKHVDNHAVAFHPVDREFLLVGCDGGLYKSYDRGQTYSFTANLPLTQFYKIDVDYDYPFYHVVGGTQDNYTQYGPTSTRSTNGIRNSDWRITIGGDGHDCAIDPRDPNTIYCESQRGFLRRFDRRTGQAVDIRPQPGKGEEDLRFNWDSPIHISPHSHTRLYFGSRKLHRSDDRGNSWTTVSGDLSRNLDRYKLKIMQRVWSIDATYDLDAMSEYGNITSISESPVVEGLLYVGTDDGLIQVSEDGGRKWRKIDKIFGVPEFFFVNDIKADRFDADTVYACVDNHKTGDYKPYILKSTDRGRSWTSIVGNLPARHLCWRLIQDHIRKDLLFAATEFGVFVTLDGGKRWLKLSGTPTISFRDLEIQRRENDLVAASFGRGIYVLDDYSPLRELSAGKLQSELVVFPIKKARVYALDGTLGRGGKSYQGDAFYTAQNPPFGAIFTYYLRDSLQSKKQRRQAAEAKVKRAGGNQRIPSTSQLRGEEREEGPTVRFTIRNAQGNIIDRRNVPATAGLHRVAWNLRHTTLTGRPFGPLVAPGKYTVAFSKRVDDVETPLGKPAEFEVVPLDDPDKKPQLAAQRALQMYREKTLRLQQSIQAASQKITDALEQVAAAKVVINGSKADRALYSESRKLETALLDLQIQISGDPVRARLAQTRKVPLTERIRNAVRGAISSSAGPTITQKQQYAIAEEEFPSLRKAVQTVIETQIPAFFKKLDSAGVPWSKGRRLK